MPPEPHARLRPPMKPHVKSAWIVLSIAWILFFIPFPFVGLIGWVVNFAAFILAIVTLVKGDHFHGIFQLVGTILISPILYLLSLIFTAFLLVQLGSTIESSPKSIDQTFSTAPARTVDSGDYVITKDSLFRDGVRVGLVFRSIPDRPTIDKLLDHYRLGLNIHSQVVVEVDNGRDELFPVGIDNCDGTLRFYPTFGRGIKKGSASHKPIEKVIVLDSPIEKPMVRRVYTPADPPKIDSEKSYTPPSETSVINLTEKDKWGHPIDISLRCYSSISIEAKIDATSAIKSFSFDATWERSRQEGQLREILTQLPRSIGQFDLTVGRNL